MPNLSLTLNPPFVREQRSPWSTVFSAPLKSWLIHIAAFSAGGALVAFFFYTSRDVGRGSVSNLFLRNVLFWGAYGLFTPVLTRVAWKLRWTPGREWGTASLLFCAAALFVVGHLTLNWWLRELWAPTRVRVDFFTGLLSRLRGMLVIWDLIVFMAIVGVSQSLGYRRRLLEIEVDRAELERKLVEARMAALTMQLQPHFLFNTLHMIGVLTRKDPEAANRMIARLGDLLRQTLDNAHTNEVSLRKEIDFLKPYLDIQKTRFRDRLNVTIEVPQDTLDLQVPNLLLQPLVENAVKHGIEANAEGGHIHVTAARNGDWLELAVIDNGVGLPSDGSLREGVGIGNTRERLRRLYGDSHEFLIAANNGGGTRVDVKVPAHQANEAPETSNHE